MSISPELPPNSFTSATTTSQSVTTGATGGVIPTASATGTTGSLIRTNINMAAFLPVNPAPAQGMLLNPVAAQPVAAQDVDAPIPAYRKMLNNLINDLTQNVDDKGIQQTGSQDPRTGIVTVTRDFTTKDGRKVHWVETTDSNAPGDQTNQLEVTYKTTPPYTEKYHASQLGADFEFKQSNLPVSEALKVYQEYTDELKTAKEQMDPESYTTQVSGNSVSESFRTKNGNTISGRTITGEDNKISQTYTIGSNAYEIIFQDGIMVSISKSNVGVFK